LNILSAIIDVNTLMPVNFSVGQPITLTTCIPTCSPIPAA
jgi:hypothetical protein